MSKNVVISNKRKFQKIKNAFSKGGVKRIHVVADFDRTLTKAFVNGRKVPSLISILRDGGYLTPDYAAKAHALYNKYHPIEVNPKISLAKKKKAMQEWWLVHFDLLIKSGLNKRDIEKVVSSGKIKLREGAVEFMDFLHTHHIPLVIFSSSGLGGDAVAGFLKKKGRLYKNIHIISNSYLWDRKGNAIGVKQPIIHVLNKDETAIQGFPFFEKLKTRKNVILLGDSLGDLGMVKGFDYDNLLKVGFLNKEVKENLRAYKKNYDVLILNDAGMEFINQTIEQFNLLSLNYEMA